MYIYKYYEATAKQGEASAQKNLGTVYGNGKHPFVHVAC